MPAFRFDNTYTRLPRLFYSKQGAVAAPAPKLVILNHALAADLGLDFSGMDDAALAALFASVSAVGTINAMAVHYAQNAAAPASMRSR